VRSDPSRTGTSLSVTDETDGRVRLDLVSYGHYQASISMHFFDNREGHGGLLRRCPTFIQSAGPAQAGPWFSDHGRGERVPRSAGSHSSSS
jgi:hypothetical protein